MPDASPSARFGASAVAQAAPLRGAFFAAAFFVDAEGLRASRLRLSSSVR
jgi:hypothetical protein